LAALRVRSVVLGFYRAAEAAAQSLGLKVVALPVHNAAEIERGIRAFAEAAGGLIVALHATTLGHRKLIIELAARHRLPAVYSDRYFVESGGLLAFGNNTPDLFRRAASYVDRIFKGDSPAGLPVQLPTKTHLAIQLGAQLEIAQRESRSERPASIARVSPDGPLRTPGP